MSFSELGLCDPILKAVAEQGYEIPTPIQAKAIPIVLAGQDIIAAAQTGTGKTASFVLPLLEKLNNGHSLRGKRIRALILTPTRELAIQVENSVQQYGKHLSLSSMAMYGGIDSEQQKQELIGGIDILVATPGRLLDMAHQRALHFDELDILILDEADKMLDMGFIADINKIIERLPSKRQNLLFSATLSDDVRFLAKTAIHDAAEISISSRHSEKPKIGQWLITVDKDNKSSLLSHVLKEHQWTQTLVFIRTKHGAAKLASQLEKRGIPAEAIHSGKSQAVRTQLLSDFKAGKITVLIATDIASRGLDIEELACVINYDMPYETDDYIHRIGRTGRAGASGEAVSLVSRDDFKNLCAIESRLGHLIERRDIKEFAPKKEVPISVLNFTPQNIKKPKVRIQGEKNQTAKKHHKTRSTNKPFNKSINKPTKKDQTNPWGHWENKK
jgi:superfamily II DNA/RNA helicase